MRFLRVLRLGFIDPRLFGKPLLPVQLHDHVANLADRLLRQIERVGAHIGDETDLALADVDAFVQLLRDAHGLLRAEAQFAGGLLLQGRGRERRRGIALALLAIDVEHLEFAVRGVLQRAFDLAGLPLRRKTELLYLGALILDQLARKLLLRMFKLGIDGPVLTRHERRDFVLALADHAQGGTLHAARGQARAHFLPEQRREIEPHQKIQRAPCLLRVHEVHGQLARARHRFTDRVLGDFIEHHALHVLALEFALGFQELVQMP